MKRLGVVIVTYDSARYLEVCLESLFAELEGQDFRVVVVDNASRDDVGEFLDEQVTLISNASNLGFATAANQGIRWCQDEGCEEILLLNPDTMMESGSLDLIRQALSEDEKRVVVQPLITLMKDPGKVNTWGNTDKGFGLVSLGGYKKPVRLADSGPIQFASGACMLVSAGVFAEIGYLDEGFFLYFEDTEFSKRVRERGYSLWLEAGARVRHDYQRPFSREKVFRFLKSWRKYRVR